MAALNLGSQLGKGGEGTVYAVGTDGRLALKVYTVPLSARQRGKLERQIELSLKYPELKEFAAWPLDKANLGEHGGFLMPFIQGRPIHQLYRPVDRREHFSFADWSSLVHVARNVAATFNVLHRSAIVMGDVNESNMFVTPNGEVRLIDCDSYQIPKADGTFYTCDVGVPMWTPPELQGFGFEGLTRTVEHDRFGLAVLIFHLLFMGRHPFSGVPIDPQAEEAPAIEMAIKGGYFAYSLRKNGAALTKQPPHTLSLKALPEGVASLFERAFSSAPAARPDATEWYEGLGTLQFERCAWGHVHYRELADCPWCAIWQGGGPNFFFVANARPPGGSSNELELISREVQRLTPAELVVPDRANLQMPLVQGAVFPSHIGENRVLFYVGCVVLGLAFVVWLAAPGALIILLLIGFIGAALLVGGKSNPAFAKEIAGREEVFQAANRQLDNLLEATGRETDLYRRTFAHQKNIQLQRLGLLSGRQRSLVSLRENLAEQYARNSQMTAFLSHKKLRDAGLHDLGQNELLALRQRGIESAIEVGALDEKSGIALPLLSRLRVWLAECEDAFQFDPSVPPENDAARAVDREVLQLEQKWIAEAIECRERLLILTSRAQQNYEHFETELHQLLQAVGKASAERVFLKEENLKNIG